MPGFIISVQKQPLFFASEKRQKLIISTTEGEGYRVERRVVNKFMDDRLFVDDDDLLIVTEGVILNKKELIAKYAPDGQFATCVRVMYAQLGDAFFRDFRGSFSGALYDKQADKWLIYTDHIGDKQIFSSQTPDGWLFGSEIGFLVETRKANGLPVSVDKTGCYMSLTHGFCIEDRTLVTEVRKLIAGHYYVLTKEGLRDIQYHRFSNQPKTDMTVDEAVEGIDRLFRQAVRRQFEKDKEYGYRHLACLSGGLDSRMTVWVGHDMGYTDQLNICFSQSGYLDFTISQQIAIDLHHDYLFKPLDGGDCIDTIEDITPITWGSANFFNLAHGKSMEDLINYDQFGIIHTGQIGDSIIGTFFKKNEYNPEAKVGQSAYSVELIERLQDYQLVEHYDNEEIFCLYTRAFTGADQGLLTFQENAESCSPFTDVDFVEFCYSIPLNLRFNHKIYFDWILRKYPGAANYVWEKTREKIKPFENKPPRYMTVLGYKVPHVLDPAFGNYLKGFVLRRLGLRKKGQKPKTITLKTADDMNPVDYWYATNPYLKEFMDGYWRAHKDCIEDEALSADMKHLYEDCVLYDKLQCLSVLSAINHIKCILDI